MYFCPTESLLSISLADAIARGLVLGAKGGKSVSLFVLLASLSEAGACEHNCGDSRTLEYEWGLSQLRLESPTGVVAYNTNSTSSILQGNDKVSRRFYYGKHVSIEEKCK